MILTEEEAKRRQCRAVSPLMIPKQGLGGVQFEVKMLSCEGSGCMMWRWSPEPFENGEHGGSCGLAMPTLSQGPEKPKATVTALQPRGGNNAA